MKDSNELNGKKKKKVLEAPKNTMFLLPLSVVTVTSGYEI